MSGLSNLASILRARSFVFLWVAQIISQIAFNMLNFVLLLRVYQLTGKNTAVSVLVLAFMLPQLILSLFAGVFVDRFDKKLVMSFTNIARALCLLPLIFIHQNLIVIYIFAFAVSTATQFFVPAEASMIPKLVRKRLLLSGNSIFIGTLYGSIIIGYILAGPALKFLGLTTVLTLLALLFLLSAGFNLLLPGSNGGEYLNNQMKRIFSITYNRIITVVFNDIGEMLYAIISSRHLLPAIIFMTISQAVIVVLGALLPGYAATILGIDVEDSSLILLAPAAFGMVLGSFFVAQIGVRMKKSRLVVPGVILSGILMLLLSFFSRLSSTNINVLYLVVVTCFLLGVFNAFVIVPANTIIGERSAESIRGRIYGMFNTSSALAAILLVTTVGYFSDIFGISRVLSVLGGGIILLGFLPLLRGKEDI